MRSDFLEGLDKLEEEGILFASSSRSFIFLIFLLSHAVCIFQRGEDG